jgi:hypothetical protein
MRSGQSVTDDEACRWVAVGLVLLTVGLWLLRLDGSFLVPLWGTALTLIGGVVAIVGLGVLLRLWR